MLADVLLPLVLERPVAENLDEVVPLQHLTLQQTLRERLDSLLLFLTSATVRLYA